MIGLLILAEKNLGAGLIATVAHTLGGRPPQLEATEFDHSAPPELIETSLRQSIQKVERGEGVLILADVYGATHTNIACRQLKRGTIELITGINLPMLLRVVCHPATTLPALAKLAGEGGRDCIVYMNSDI